MRIKQRTIARRTAIYRGAEPTSLAPVRYSIALDADDPEAVECDACGAFVKRLVSGRPRAHAAGGLMTNTRAGRYHCSGSGTHG